MNRLSFLFLVFWFPGCDQGQTADRDGSLDEETEYVDHADNGSDRPAGDNDSEGKVAIRLSAKGVEHCPVEPPASPGLARVTPTGSCAGILKVELLRERDDLEPVAIALAAPLVEVVFNTEALVAEGNVPEGNYRFIRYSLAYGSVTVPARAHNGVMLVPGSLEFNVATTNYQDSTGHSRTAGELLASFSAYGFTFSFQASVPLDCPLSDSGGLVETGDSYRITVPIPGGPITVNADGPTQELLAVFPLFGAVTWIDIAGGDFTVGVLDILSTPLGSETPARLPICDLLLSDRCAENALPVRHTAAWPMPDSATTTCTDGSAVISCPEPGSPGAGQDGSYLVNPVDYVAEGETVVDRVTGLLWQKEPASEAMDWWEARDYCSNLILADRDDWSLPSRLELVSLLDLGRFGPSIDLQAFPDAPSDFFWSASPALFSGLAFGVRFDQGFVYDHDPRVSGRVRCVTDVGTGSENRLKISDETVLDTSTGLVWQRGSLPPASWLDAIAACEDLVIGGTSDWRLPTLKELLTIVEETALSPSTDIAAFPDTAAQWFWASSPGLAPPDYGWTVSFTDGFCTPAAVTELYLSRCVTDPNP